MPKMLIKLLTLSLLISIIPAPMMAMEEQPRTLHQAAENNDTQLLRSLLKAGAYIEEKDQDDNTPLMLAAGFGNHEAVVELIKANANPNATNGEGHTALMLACATPKYGEIITALIDAGANVNARTASAGNTALLYAIIFDLSDDITACLLEVGADTSIWNDYGTTPLAYASADGRLENAITLLQYGDNPNMRNIFSHPGNVAVVAERGATPLMLAATSNMPALCEALMKYDADIFAKSDQGLTALDCAAASDCPDCVKNIICCAFILNDTQENNEIDAQNRIKAALLCFNRMKVPRDIKRHIVSFLHEDLIQLFTPQIKNRKLIPLFFQKSLTGSIYESTCEKLTPLMLKAQEIMDLAQAQGTQIQKADEIRNMLNTEEFELNFSNQLRENIKTRIANPQPKLKRISNQSPFWTIFKRWGNSTLSGVRWFTVAVLGFTMTDTGFYYFILGTKGLLENIIMYQIKLGQNGTTFSIKPGTLALIGAAIAGTGIALTFQNCKFKPNSNPISPWVRDTQTLFFMLRSEPERRSHYFN